MGVNDDVESNNSVEKKINKHEDVTVVHLRPTLQQQRNMIYTRKSPVPQHRLKADFNCPRWLKRPTGPNIYVTNRPKYRVAAINPEHFHCFTVVLRNSLLY